MTGILIDTPDGQFEMYALKPAQWPSGERIFKDPKDEAWTHRTDVLRVETGSSVIPSITVAVTPVLKDGHPVWKYCRIGRAKELKVKVEFINDGEPNEFVRGIAYCEA